MTTKFSPSGVISAVVGAAVLVALTGGIIAWTTYKSISNTFVPCVAQFDPTSPVGGQVSCPGSDYTSVWIEVGVTAGIVGVLLLFALVAGAVRIGVSSPSA